MTSATSTRPADPRLAAHSLIGEIKAGHAYLAEVEAVPLPPCRCSSFVLQYEGVCLCERGQEERRRERLVATRRVADLAALPALLAIAEAGLTLRAEGQQCDDAVSAVTGERS